MTFGALQAEKGGRHLAAKMYSFLMSTLLLPMSTLLLLSATSMLGSTAAQGGLDVPDFSAGFNLQDIINVLKMLENSLNEGLDGLSPPQLQPGSDLFLLRNELIAIANEILTVSAQQGNEQDLLELAILGMDQGPLNFGLTAGGQANLTRAPDILDVSCYGAFPFRCYAFDKYRTISGICNNLANPLWGSAGSRLRRFVPAQYSDGFQEPRGTRQSATSQCLTGNKKPSDCPEQCRSDPTALLPNPRYVSVNFHPDVDQDSYQVTALFTQFGQFLDHDISLTPEEAGVVNCCDNTQCFYGCALPSGGQSDGQGCFKIDIPCRDPCFSPNKPFGELGRTSCLKFIRSAPFCQAKSTVREQMNGITSFIDASNVYGSTLNVSRSLRTFVDGQMKESFNSLLPIIDGVFTAGDVRARQNPGLTSLHTIWLREHNRIAHQLLKNSSLVGCTDEKLYQEARRIVIAEMQNVVYSEFLPNVFGIYAYNYYYYYYYLYTFRLPLNQYTDYYDPTDDPTIRNGFATAAFRFGHSLIQDLIQIYSLDTFSQKSSSQLKDVFFDMTDYMAENGKGMEEVIWGLLAESAKQFDRFVVDDVTTFLFANLDQVGSDLVARNIQRGRDHGLGSYNDYREYCNLGRICSWNDQPYDISMGNWQQLRTIYDDPNDIDLFVGGLAEDWGWYGGLLGRTFTCLIGEQFQHLKFGDRFFFTFQQNNPYPFTQAQIYNIQNRKLSDIICDNALFIKKLPYRVFEYGSSNNCQFGNYCNVCGSNYQLDLNLLTSGSSSTATGRRSSSVPAPRKANQPMPKSDSAQ